MDVSTFLAIMIALSVAVERIVEILKAMLGGMPVVRILFEPCKTQNAENVRCAFLYLLSAAIGGLIAGFSNVNVLPGSQHPDLSYAVAGLLASGGSAFWNHALDLMQAAKVAREEVTAALVKQDPRAPVMAGLPAQK